MSKTAGGAAGEEAAGAAPGPAGSAGAPGGSRVEWAPIEAKWRKRWEEERAHEADADPSRPKRFVTVAYPYPNSPQHVGHGRTYTIADAHARYLRMRGHNVLFPMGFHYTGTPILGMARRVQDGDAELLAGLRDLYGVPDEAVAGFSDPVRIADYFHEEIKAGMVEMGYSIDWRREFTTIDPAYKRFVEWQIGTLRGMGLVVQGSHPVGWCPKDQNPVSQHDTLGDVEPGFAEYTLVKFRLEEEKEGGRAGGAVIPAATLRPETLFGVTNLWVDPDAEYVRAAVSGGVARGAGAGERGDGPAGEPDKEEWIVSAECARKLEFLGRRVERTGTVRGADLVGRTAAAPGTGAAGLPILPARFVRQGTGTGMVMSVPAHAPYDWRALEDLKEAGGGEGAAPGVPRPVKIIESKEYAGAECPAAEACRRLGIKGQGDTELLDRATDEVYGKEFYGGAMAGADGGAGDAASPVPAGFAGMKVPDARDAVGEWLSGGLPAGQDSSEAFLEISGGPVKCRCGAECVVKMLSDQWFLDYGNAAWKANAHECLSRMAILPRELRGEFGNVVDWLRERACARQHGLGTNLPWDDGWIVESLSDSVIYMAFYTISGLVGSGALRAEHLTPAFFDYVFLGIGGGGGGDPAERIARETGADAGAVRRARAEFAYFYPVDARHSGRDLVPNHLTFFVMNHTAIFGRDSWPRGIVVNGSVLMDGKKMSKSMGNIIPLRRAISEHGADTIRLAILVSAELLQDADFGQEAVSGVAARLGAMLAECGRLGGRGAGGAVGAGCGEGAGGAASAEDRWLLSRARALALDVTSSIEKMRLREALHTVLFSFESDLQWHRKRRAAREARGKGGPAGGDPDAVLREVCAVRVLLLSPFAPHAADEMWERLGMEGMASAARWPEPPAAWDDPAAVQAEDLLGRVIGDVASIMRVTKRKSAPQRITAYVAGGLKARAYRTILGMMEGGGGQAAQGEGGKRKGRGSGADMGAVMQALIADPETAGIKADPGFVQRAIKDALAEPARIREARLRAGGRLDERGVLEADLGALAAAEFGGSVQVRVFSEEDGDVDDPAGKARHARPFRPALFIE